MNNNEEILITNQEPPKVIDAIAIFDENNKILCQTSEKGKTIDDLAKENNIDLTQEKYVQRYHYIDSWYNF